MKLNCLGRNGLEMLILLMHEVFSNSMDLRNGGSILSVKLIFRKDLRLMKMDIIIVVLQYLFLKVCKWTDRFAQKINWLFFLVADHGSKSKLCIFSLWIYFWYVFCRMSGFRLQLPDFVLLHWIFDFGSLLPL